MRYMRWTLGAGLALAAAFAVVVLAPTEGDATQFCITCGTTTPQVTVKFQGYSTENAGTVGSGDNGGSCSLGVCSETTWAAGFLQAVSDGNSNTLWANGVSGPGQQVAFLIVGVADKSITGPDGSGNFTINNVGSNNTGQTANYGSGSVDIGTGQDGHAHVLLYSYVGAAPNFNSITTSGRTGFENLNGITNIAGADLMADFEMIPGVVSGDGTTVLQQIARSQTLPTTGTGTFYADCAAGYACDTQFSNGGSFASGVIAALFGQFTLEAASQGTASGAAANGWEGFINDPDQVAVPTPEPASMALLGSALIGFGAAARRRRRKNSNA